MKHPAVQSLSAALRGRLALTPALALLTLILWALPSPAAINPDIEKEYRQRLRDMPKSPDMEPAWRDLVRWLETQDASQIDAAWIRYAQYQTSLAARKKIGKNDVQACLTLANEMERWTGKRNITDEILMTGLKNNPSDPRLFDALMKSDKLQKFMAVKTVYESRKAEAEKARAPVPFKNLADWLAAYETLNPQIVSWKDYCLARAAALGGGASAAGGVDIVHNLRTEAETILRKPFHTNAPLVKVDIREFLPHVAHTNMTREELDNNALAFKIVRAGNTTYAQTAPLDSSPQEVWARGTRIFNKSFMTGDTLWMQSHQELVWNRRKWDPETKRWCECTEAEKRMAHVKAIEFVQKKLAGFRKELSEAHAVIARSPGDTDRALRLFQDALARGLTDPQDFQREKTKVLNAAQTHHGALQRKQYVEKEIEAWNQQLVKLGVMADAMDPPAPSPAIPQPATPPTPAVPAISPAPVPPAPAVPATPPPPEAPAASADAWPSLSIVGVSGNGKTGVVLINGKIYSEGDTVSGVRVKAISGGAATLEYNGQTRTVRTGSRL